MIKQFLDIVKRYFRPYRMYIAWSIVLNVVAHAIPERAYTNEEAQVYGLTFDFAGNTATTMQFVLTDSVHHFFRGAVYFSAVPNEDSIAPVAAFVREDMLTLIESFRWREKNS